jgi:uncharacterized protein YjbI with pentapeptide repeats
MCLAGMNYRQAGLTEATDRPLELDGLNLSGIQWQGAGLRGAQLQGAKLINPVIDYQTSFKSCKTDSETWVGVNTYGSEAAIDAAATHALRIRLRDVNGLVLPDAAYTEYANS